MDRSLGFGSVISDNCPIKARFHFGSSMQYFNLPLTTSRRLILQQARRQTLIVVLLLLVSLRFHVLFHSPPGVLFTFPSRYCFTIGYSVVFSLTRWSSLLHTGFHVPHATLDTTILFQVFDYKTFTFFGLTFQLILLTLVAFFCCSTTPFY